MVLLYYINFKVTLLIKNFFLVHILIKYRKSYICRYYIKYIDAHLSGKRGIEHMLSFNNNILIIVFHIQTLSKKINKIKTIFCNKLSVTIVVIKMTKVTHKLVHLKIFLKYRNVKMMHASVLTTITVPDS